MPPTRAQNLPPSPPVNGHPSVRRYSRIMLTLPTITWGDPTADRRALLVHGLSSSAETWWRMGEALSADGWFITAVDLRGHGDAPLADDYSVAGYVSDLPRAAGGRAWDLVIGHSLGGAVATVASAVPGFAERLVLLDPALYVPDSEWAGVRAEQLADLDYTAESLRASQPHWDDRDIAAKVRATARAGTAMIEGTLDDNHPWSVLPQLYELTVPTLILTGDPAVYTMLPPALVEPAVAANAHLGYRAIPGAGHSPHREEWPATIAAIRDWLARP